MAGTSLAAHLRRLAVVLGIATLIALPLVLYGWTSSRPAAAVGNSIAVPDSTGDVGQSTSLALDAAGNPVVAYFDATNADLKVLHCGNQTCTAGNIITSPDTTGDVGIYPSIALDAAGHPVIAYYDNTNNDLKVLHCGDPSCTAGNAIATPDTTGDVGAWTSLALDASGNPVVSYYDGTNADLKLLHCGSPACTAANTITAPDTTDYVGAYTSMALDSVGYPVVSYTALTTLLPSGMSSLRVLRCGNAVCSSGNTIASPATSTIFRPFSAPSLALDTSGNPVVSYVQQGIQFSMPASLLVLHCGNPACTLGNSIASPTLVLAGTNTSLKLDASGNPVVAATYFDLGTATLQLVHCGNATCTAGNTAAFPDPPVVGEFPSLMLDGIGNPVVSYYDKDNGDLRVLHCGDLGCLIANAPTVTPTSTPTRTFTPTPTPTATTLADAIALGGVADYPNVSGGSRAWPIALLATAIGVLAIGGIALYARRRSSC